MRTTGTYRTTCTAGEAVPAFVPAPLPPADPPFELDGRISRGLAAATEAIDQLRVAGATVPSTDWFLYSFVRREALITSVIEGTQATLEDVLTFEATSFADRPDDVREVCNYIDALNYARAELARPNGLPLSTRLLCEAHRRLMQGARGDSKLPGELRRSQNWIGGTRPGNARFVPPPPDLVPALMSDLERWLHAADPLPPLIRAGLSHVQFETIHPFLDGNGRIGRLLIALLLEHWGILDSPILYLSLALKRRQREYYDHLTAVRDTGDWEGWTAFFLECIADAAADGVRTAQQLAALIVRDRDRFLADNAATIPAARLLALLPSNPIINSNRAIELLDVSKPTALKAIESLQRAGILEETTGKRRDRIYAYAAYLALLAD